MLGNIGILNFHFGTFLKLVGSLYFAIFSLLKPQCFVLFFVCRQEKLEQLAARFDRKSGMRETWLSENQRLVSQDNFGFDLPSVEAAAKKHEAIETDIYAYEERVQAVVAVAQELESQNYHDIARIQARLLNILFVIYSYSLM